MGVHHFDDSSVAPSTRDQTRSGDPERYQDRGRRRAWFIAALMLALVGGVYLVQQHWTHLAGNWVYIVLLLCPLMHLFMHGGHGNHSDHGSHQSSSDHDSRGGRSD